MFALHRPERHLRRDTFAWRADGVERPSPRTRGSGPTCGGGHSSLLQSPHQDARCGPNAPVPPTAHLSLSRGRRDIKSEGGRGWPGWGLLFPFRPYWAEEGQLREPAGKRAVLVTAPPVAARRPPHTRGLAVPTEAPRLLQSRVVRAQPGARVRRGCLCGGSEDNLGFVECGLIHKRNAFNQAAGMPSRVSGEAQLRWGGCPCRGLGLLPGLRRCRRLLSEAGISLRPPSSLPWGRLVTRGGPGFSCGPPPRARRGPDGRGPLRRHSGLQVVPGGQQGPVPICPWTAACGRSPCPEPRPARTPVVTVKGAGTLSSQVDEAGGSGLGPRQGPQVPPSARAPRGQAPRAPAGAARLPASLRFR